MHCPAGQTHNHTRPGSQATLWLGRLVASVKVCAIWLLAGVIWSGAVSVTRAAERYAVDEPVEVFFLNSWIDAQVKDSNKKGEVLCEFVFANRTQQQIFQPDKVRHKYESGAIARGRSWSDATGKYKIKAALLKISGGKVELRTDENKEVTIAIDKLSTTDQAFIKRFQQQNGVAALPVPALPSVETFDTSRSKPKENKGRQSRRKGKIETEKAYLTLPADPIRKGLELKQAGVGFPNIEFNDRVRSLISLGGADNWLLTTVVADDNDPARLVWVALGKQTVKRIQMLPAGEVVLDYHAVSRQLLTYSRRRENGQGLGQTFGQAFGRGTEVFTIWKTDPNAEECQAVISWVASLPDDRDIGFEAPWARFASGTQVVQLSSSHRLLSWDFAQKQLSWDTVQDSFFRAPPSLSAGGKYVLLPEDGGLRIVDSISGDMLAQVPMERCTGVGVHPDGKRLAVAGDNSIFVVDITGEQPIRKVNAGSVVSPFETRIDWVSDSLLCFEGQGLRMVLFSLDLELPIWSYSFDGSALLAGFGARTHSIVDSHLVYAASFMSGTVRGLAVGAVELPGEKAKQAIASVRREDFIVAKAGSRFRLDISAIDHVSEIRTALLDEINKNSWVYDESAPNVIRAEYKRGDTQQVRYELQSMRGGGRNLETASVTPMVALLEIKIGNSVAWTSSSSSGVPPLIMMREGESLQDHLNRTTGGEVWSFYQNVDIPTEIIDPNKRNGVGSTAVTTRGLVEEVKK